ncbi:MAG: polymerase, sigma-24 subunit, subfamily [Akkermansiaceae bacterium]|nr:polymerase, sigma-24 subunit, subfamily [Akkermansiaceae bacterium]
MKRDAENLRQFIATGDQAAFSRMVADHAAMVHGVAMRRAHDRGQAEDVTQMVFAILARKAGSVPAENLAGWLHRVAFIQASSVHRSEARRREVMQQIPISPMIDDPNIPAAAWRDIRPHLDEVMGRLEMPDRQLVILRFFEQRSFREISEVTGRTEEAARKQIRRVLDRLAALLRRRGIVAPGTALGAILAAQVLTSPPASAALLASAALQAAPALPASVLFSQSFYLMTTKTALKSAAVVLAIAAAVPASIYYQHRSKTGAQAASPSSFSPLAADASTGSPGPARKAPVIVPTAAKVDWRKLIAMQGAAGGSAVQRGAFYDDLQKKFAAMSAEDLAEGLDQILSMNLPEDQGHIGGLLVAALLEKDPRLAYARFAKVSSDNNEIYFRLADGMKQWAQSDGVTATAWLDEQIKAGRFDSKALDGHSDLPRFEAALLSTLLKADPSAARARLAAMSVEERTSILGNYLPMLHIPVGREAELAGLIRSQLPADQTTNAMASAAASMVHRRGFDGIAKFMDDSQATAGERQAMVTESVAMKLGIYGVENGEPNSGDGLAAIDKARAWAEREAPGSADTATGQALGLLLTRNYPFQESASVALHYLETTGSDGVLAAFLNTPSAQKNPQQVIDLLPKIADPKVREEIRSKVQP